MSELFIAICNYSGDFLKHSTPKTFADESCVAVTLMHTKCNKLAKSYVVNLITRKSNC